MIRIALVEDHNIVRSGIKASLGGEKDIEVVAETGNGPKLLQLLADGLETHVVLTDINMPGMDGLALGKIMNSRYPRIRIIVFTMYDQPEYLTEAFRSGAAGYVLKSASPDELAFAIRHTCLRNQRYLCTELAIRMLDRILKTAEVPVLQDSNLEFTRRELEVLSLVSEGYTNQEIADRLYTSKRTVEGHRQSLIEKTGVRNSSALIRYAFLNGLIK